MKWFSLLMIPVVVLLAIVFTPYIWENANFNPSANELIQGRIMLGVSAILLLVDLLIIARIIKKKRTNKLTDDDNLWMWLIGISLFFLSTLFTSFVLILPVVGWTIICILIGSFPIVFIAAIIKIKIDESKQTKISN